MASDEEEEETVCRLSHPAHPHTLSRRAGTNPPAGCFRCSGSDQAMCFDSFHYHCTTCDVEFHALCHIWPRKITHPYHPQHPLIYSVLDRETGILTDHDGDSDIPYHGNIFDNCTWCGVTMKAKTITFYRCPICSFCLDLSCSQKFPLPVIANPKSHHHSLIFLPRPLLVPCDVCGLVEKSVPSYACFQCNYVVHKGCVDLPRAIKITRHPHRLFYTPFLSPPTSPPCRLCYKTVDIKYGQYSCSRDDCSYVVHSKCATHEAIWDGRELEWEPDDEFDETEDVAPFKKVGHGLIKYFCHEHHLKLERHDAVRDADKQCRACVLHIDSRDFYNCMQCDFSLHEVCANLPRKLDHALHHHPLSLDPVPPHDFYSMNCLVCSRKFTGFVYKCSKSNCEMAIPNKFQVDVGCILVPDCFTHKSHKHPLFIPIYTGEEINLCGGCNTRYALTYLKCTLCEFSLCYNCATIPDKLHYKYEAFPLSLCYGEASDETYWCEACEEELDPSQWFYTCEKPDITIHVGCLFGSSSYMKPGYTFYCRSVSVKVLCNSGNTRPVCWQCYGRCSSSVYFKLSDEVVICSCDCLATFVSRWWQRL